MRTLDTKGFSLHPAYHNGPHALVDPVQVEEIGVVAAALDAAYPDAAGTHRTRTLLERIQALQVELGQLGEDWDALGPLWAAVGYAVENGLTGDQIVFDAGVAQALGALGPGNP